MLFFLSSVKREFNVVDSLEYELFLLIFQFLEVTAIDHDLVNLLRKTGLTFFGILN